MMKKLHISKPALLLWTIVLSICTISCDGSYRDKKRLQEADYAPLGIVFELNSKYTEDGRVIANLKARHMKDFSNQEYPYQEFPEGLELFFWGEDSTLTTVTSKYAIRYDGSGLVDLRDSVVVKRPDSTLLNAEQLYWNENDKWVFTDRPYKITLSDGSYNNGTGFDSNEDFTIFLSRKNSGIQLIDNDQLSEEEGD